MPGRHWRYLTLSLSAIAAFLLFSMMALTFADVLGRYVFIAPIPGAFEIVEFMLALLIFAGLPLVTFDNAHITVSILDGLFGPRALWVKQLVILLASAVAVGFIADRMWDQATDMVEAETITGFLEIDIAPIIYALSVLSALTCVVQLWMAWEHLRGGMPPSNDDDGLRG